MIRFDQRNFDVQEAERLFKKVIHPTHGHNSIKLVDEDGIPMRAPNSATLSRLHSSYVLTPRGVPARKSSHSYSGQIAKDRMHNLVNSMDTNSHDAASLGSGYPYGLSSAGSSRHYVGSHLNPKRRTLGSRPPRSVKAMSKTASARSRFLTMTPDENMFLDSESEKWNGSPQGQRLEKEWAALSQCRALKRSSEIVSHRVDRMYFMAGNKLKLQQKYHVEDDELEHLKELSQARASARPTRWSSKTKKGDVYRPDRSAASSKTMKAQGAVSEPDSQSEQVNGVLHDSSGKSSRASKEERVKEDTDPASNIIVTQKPLTPKPSSCKSPLEGWSEDGKGNREPTETELISNLKDTTLHDDQVNGLEVQSHDGNGARENTVNSKENADEMQNNEDIKLSDKENGVVVKNGETGFIGGNAKRAEDENGENRTENPIFVTESLELGNQSVQEKENSGNVTNDVDSETNGEVVHEKGDKMDKYDTD